MALIAEEFASEIADMSSIEILWREPRRFESAFDDLAHTIGEFAPRPRPVLREVGLITAEDVDVVCHIVDPVRSSDHCRPFFGYYHYASQSEAGAANGA